MDLRATGTLTDDVGQALTVIRYKTGKYTVQRPLQLGALLAGAGPRVLDSCADYGIPLGEAFQLRDDLLGVFGDPQQTGKPVLDDLREGKHTVLLALALHRADPEQRGRLHDLIGNPELDDTGAAEIRQILTSTGARTTIEDMIVDRRDQVCHALRDAPFSPVARRLLRDLADTLTNRHT